MVLVKRFSKSPSWAELKKSWASIKHFSRMENTKISTTFAKKQNKLRNWPTIFHVRALTLVKKNHYDKRLQLPWSVGKFSSRIGRSNAALHTTALSHNCANLYRDEAGWAVIEFHANGPFQIFMFGTFFCDHIPEPENDAFSAIINHMFTNTKVV